MKKCPLCSRKLNYRGHVWTRDKKHETASYWCQNCKISMTGEDLKRGEAKEVNRIMRGKKNE